MLNNRYKYNVTTEPGYLIKLVIIYDLTSHYNQLYHYYVQLYHYHFRLYHYHMVIFPSIMEPQCQVTCLTSWLLWLYITISNYIIITSNYIIIILLYLLESWNRSAKLLVLDVTLYNLWLFNSLDLYYLGLIKPVIT